MDELPADAAAAGLAEALDGDMDQSAWLGILIAHDRLGRLDVLQPRQTRPFRTRPTVAGKTATSSAMCRPVNCWRRKATIRPATGASGHARHHPGPRRTIGHAGASFGLEALDPARHDPAEGSLQPMRIWVRAAWALETRPSVTGSAISSRRNGGSRAFLWMFIRTLRRVLKPGNSSLPGPVRMGNLLETHIQWR